MTIVLIIRIFESMKNMLLTIALLLLVRTAASGQGRLVSVLQEQTLTLDQQIDSVIQEFSIITRKEDLGKAFRILKMLGRRIHCVSLTYRTLDPKGRETVASGLIAFPEHGVFRGTVQMLPYNRESKLCGSRRLYSPEVMASILGYVTLIPDNIGYGSTDSLTIAYQMCENSAEVSAHLQEAAKEFFTQYRKRKLPANTYIFGYSLGAPGALALAYRYAETPGIRLKGLCIGSGAYDPSLVLEHSLATGEMGYLIYPGFVQSLNAWLNADLHPEYLFKGRVLEEYTKIADGSRNPKDLAEEYGNNVHDYLHPDFFTEEENDDIRHLKAALAGLSVLRDEKKPLPASVRVVVRHSKDDEIIPVICSDYLVQQLRAPFHWVCYLRDNSRTHYQTGPMSFIDLALMLL